MKAEIKSLFNEYGEVDGLKKHTDRIVEWGCSVSVLQLFLVGMKIMWSAGAEIMKGGSSSELDAHLNSVLFLGNTLTHMGMKRDMAMVVDGVILSPYAYDEDSQAKIDALDIPETIAGAMAATALDEFHHETFGGIVSVREVFQDLEIHSSLDDLAFPWDAYWEGVELVKESQMMRRVYGESVIASLHPIIRSLIDRSSLSREEVAEKLLDAVSSGKDEVSVALGILNDTEGAFTESDLSNGSWGGGFTPADIRDDLDDLDVN